MQFYWFQTLILYQSNSGRKYNTIKMCSTCYGLLLIAKVPHYKLLLVHHFVFDIWPDYVNKKFKMFRNKVNEMDHSKPCFPSTTAFKESLNDKEALCSIEHPREGSIKVLLNLRAMWISERLEERWRCCFVSAPAAQLFGLPGAEVKWVFTRFDQVVECLLVLGQKHGATRAVSSSYWKSAIPSLLREMSLMYAEKGVGDNTQPWGTPVFKTDALH